MYKVFVKKSLGEFKTEKEAVEWLDASGYGEFDEREQIVIEQVCDNCGELNHACKPDKE